jgi:hypothetical protein
MHDFGARAGNPATITVAEFQTDPLGRWLLFEFL